MKKLIIFSFFIPFIFCDAFGQDVLFSVILNKGNNTCKSGEEIVQVFSGTSIYPDDQLIVVDSGYLALVHEATGLSLELTSKGVYDIARLEKMIEMQPSSVLAKYGKFLMERLNPNDDSEQQSYHAAGAVERGNEGLINIYWPSFANVYGNEALIIWEDVEQVETYIVKIKDRFNQVVTEYEVVGTRFLLRLNDEALIDENVVVVNVRAKGKDRIHSVDYGIQRLSDELRMSIQSELTAIKKALKTESAINPLLIASFFEKNELLIDAINFYNQALKDTPDPAGSKELFEKFLYRNKLK